MLKKLRLKFVLITMTLVTAMLVVILGMVIHFTQESLAEQSIQMLQKLSSDAFNPGRPDGFRGESMLPFFSLELNHHGELFANGSGHFDLSDENFLWEIYHATLETPEETGVLEEYNLRYLKDGFMNRERIFFADMSSEQATIRSLISSSILIGIGTFLVFLFISFQLAHWAIRPVEAAWKQQKQFIADASHELKTPLTVIMTNAELLNSPDYDAATKEQFTGSILTMSLQMRGLVESLLELARVDNGSIRTSFTAVDLTEITEQTCLLFEPVFFESGLMLEYEAEPGLIVRGSASHLERVLKILLDNAMKYSSAGTVNVTLQRSGNHCTLCVSNPGPEIPEEDRKNLFKRFYRADKSRHRDGSYGLGLSIAHNVVQEHQGKIWVESTGLQNSFFVQLPINGKPAAPQN